MGEISLVKSKQSYRGVLSVLEPLKAEIQEKTKDLPQVVVKINFVRTDNILATTSLDSVRGFVDFMKPFYKGKIIISEEASIGNTKEAFREFGFFDLAKSDPQVEIFDSRTDRSEKVRINYGRGQISLSLAKIYTDSPFVVSVTRAKTHNTVVVTLGIKNLLVGAIQGALKKRLRIHQGKQIHWIMAEIAKHAYPNLTIIDGALGMEGEGPGNGDPIRAGWLVASLDSLAADSLATYLMGFDIKDVGYLNLLHEAGRGKLYPKDEIEIIGSHPNEVKIAFRPHSTFEDQRRWQGAV
jgi:uncharacterized protein (DUF362 family)